MSQFQQVFTVTFVVLFYGDEQCMAISLQCFDTVGWATGMASGLQKCLDVGGDNLAGATVLSSS